MFMVLCATEHEEFGKKMCHCQSVVEICTDGNEYISIPCSKALMNDHTLLSNFLYTLESKDVLIRY